MQRLIRALLEAVVSAWGNAAHFSFPRKYSWRWKLEMLTNRYEPETTQLFKRMVKPGMVVIDIGAHIGYFTRFAARRVGRDGHVYAFEPDAENRELLIQNTKRYGNVSVSAAAVGAESGVVPFYHVEGSTGCHSTIAQENAARLEVEATTLDAFASSAGIGHVDVIKMDIEGGEWNALKGMANILRDVQHLIIEYNPSALERAGADPYSFLSALQDKGFSVTILSREKEIPLSDARNISAYLTSGSVNLHCKKS